MNRLHRINRKDVVKVFKKEKLLFIFISLLLVTQTVKLPSIEAANWPEIENSIVNNEVDESQNEDDNKIVDRYDYQAMENLGVNSHDLITVDTLETAIYKLMGEYGLSEYQVGIAYTNLENGEEVYINAEEQMIVASLYKVPMVAMFIDLIDQGILSWDSQLPYYEQYYQDGAGEITANPKKDYYSLEELAYQAIVYSDNTASFILYYYYINNFGSFRTALLDFVEYYDVPGFYYEDNYGSAYMMNLALIKIANDPKYLPLTNLMAQTDPKQLFSLFVNNMSTKYGQYENMLNDSGIFYNNNDQAVYTLIAMTRDAGYPDLFLAELNLLVNEWTFDTLVGQQ